MLMQYYSPKLMLQMQYVMFNSFYMMFIIFLFNLSVNWYVFSSSLLLFDQDVIFLTVFIYLPRILLYIFFYDPLLNTHHATIRILFDKMYLANLH